MCQCRPSDLNGDFIGDACEGFTNDRDGDTVPNVEDNCPDLPNVDQNDIDGDGRGTACQALDENEDRDGDGILDVDDNVQTLLRLTCQIAILTIMVFRSVMGLRSGDNCPRSEL